MRRVLLLVLPMALAALAMAPAALASPDPFIITPEPPVPGKPPPPPGPPPVERFEGPCGLAVDGVGDFYVADYYHDTVDRYTLNPKLEYVGQITNVSADNGPCGLAIDESTSRYLVNERHGAILRYTSPNGAGKTVLDPGPASGVAIGPSDGNTYVDDGDHVSVYLPNGSPVEVSGQPLVIGAGSLISGYGVAVSGNAATKGYVYVPDAASNTVKVYDPASDPANPIETIAIDFTSLRDSVAAVDNSSGELYVADALQPQTSECPEAAVQVFKADGSYEGRLKYNIIDAFPPGLAVDNSGTVGQGRVYVTSGNSETASVMLYPPHSAGAEAIALQGIEKLFCHSALPSGLGSEAPLPEPPPAVTCVGDSCQHLPSEPRDPTLTTLLDAAGDGPVKWFDTNKVAHVLKLRGHHHRGSHKHKARHRP